MKARIPKHREFIIDFPQDMDQAKADEGWNKLNEIVEEYKKAHNGQSVYAATFIEDCEPAVKKLQERSTASSTPFRKSSNAKPADNCVRRFLWYRQHRTIRA